jgi:predicted ester cyclase
VSTPVQQRDLQASHQRQAIVQWFEEVWNKGRREAIDEILAPDFVLHEGDVAAKGPAAFKAFFDRMRTSFSEIHVTPHEAISDGDYVCLRWSATLRHSGDGLGMKASGKQVHTTGISMVRFAGNRFAEAWQNWDMVGILEQINSTGRSELFVSAG